MKRLPPILLVTLLMTALPAQAQSVDLGPNISGYTRFLVYPHLQKGFEAVRDGDRERAYREFEQAMKLAPDSVSITGYLADAYRRFGDTEKARRLLRNQLAKHPDDTSLREALTALALPRLATPAAISPSTQPAPQRNDIPISPTVPDRAKPPQQAPAARWAATPPPQLAAAPSRRRAKKAAVTVPRATQGRHGTAAEPANARTPAPDAAYRFADAGFKASASGDFELAAQAAREAVQRAPDNDSYRRLLAYALLETGAYTEAEATARGGARPDEALAAIAGQARQRRAYAEFETANRALADGDLATAIERARSGAELAPTNVAQQIQWLGMLAAAARWEDLDAAARPLPGHTDMDSAELLLLRAHARQRLGRQDDAVADYDRALAIASGNPTLRRNTRLIATDAALAAGQPDRADGLLAGLPEPTDPAIATRRQQAQAQGERSMIPNPAVTPVLVVPKVVCVGSNHTPHCELWPGEAPQDPGTGFADAALRAYGRQSYGEAVVQARNAVAHSPDNRRYQWLYVRALMADGSTAEALEAANGFLARPDPDAEMRALRSALHEALQQPQQARADAAAALADPRLSVSSQIDLLLPSDRQRARAVLDEARRSPVMRQLSDTDAAYLAVRVGDDVSAAQAFAQAKERHQLPTHALLDAGYVSGRLGQSDAAVDYFKRAIDAAEEGRLALTPQRLFETRREVADRSRTWGAVASVGYRGISPGGQLATAPAASGDSVQAGLELYWRPQGYRDGTYFELYGGGFQTLSAQGALASGGKTTQGMLGARVKPIRSTNLVLAVERRIKMGSLAINDWLLRAGYSYTHGTDLRMDAPSWFTTQVYAEAGRFIGSHRTYATFEADVGRSIKLDRLDPHLVLFPHVVLAADHDSKLAPGQRTASGVGFGVATRYWFNEARCCAPRSYLDVSLQYRAHLSGAGRGKGVFLRITLNY